MTRKMAWIGSFYLIGLFAASFFEWEVNTAAASVLIFSAVSAIVVYKNKYIKAAVCLLSAASGMFLYGVYDSAVYENVVKYDGCGVEVKGKLIGFSEYGGDKSSYTVKGVINGDVNAVVTCYADSSFADIGDDVRFSGKAKIPEDTYTFPAKSYYKAKGIYLQINNVTDIEFTQSGFSLKRVINNYREYILDVVKDYMDADCAAVMSAMLFGDKSAIDSYEKTLMYRAGIGHIMAVSGVHLAVVCSFFWFVLSRLPLNKYLRFGILLVPAACFVLLAGATNSVIRAAVMIILVYGSGLFRRRADTFNSLGIAVIALTIFSPFAVRDASFLLSVTGVFGIGVAAPMIIAEIEKKYKMNAAVRSLIASFCVMAVVFPVTLLFFDEASVISPISNLLLLPICEIILIGGIIVTVTGGAAFAAVPILKICEICCRIVMTVSEFVGHLRFSYIPLGSSFVRIAAVSAVILSAASFLIFRNKSRAVQISAVVLTAAITVTSIYRIIPDGNIYVAVLRDKNAVAAVVHDNNSACVIDLVKGGMAADVVEKYLNQNGLYRLDAVIMNVDVNYSLASYLSRRALFDANRLLVPKEDENLTAGYDGSDITYYSKNGGKVENDGYSLEFLPDGIVILNCFGSKIIMYGSEAELDRDASYPAAVRYSGTQREYDAGTETLAVMNEKASAVTTRNKKVYIGENVKFTIDPNGEIIMEKIS